MSLDEFINQDTQLTRRYGEYSDIPLTLNCIYFDFCDAGKNEWNPMCAGKGDTEKKATRAVMPKAEQSLEPDGRKVHYLR